MQKLHFLQGQLLAIRGCSKVRRVVEHGGGKMMFRESMWLPWALVSAQTSASKVFFWLTVLTSHQASAVCYSFPFRASHLCWKWGQLHTSKPLHAFPWPGSLALPFSVSFSKLDHFIYKTRLATSYRQMNATPPHHHHHWLKHRLSLPLPSPLSKAGRKKDSHLNVNPPLGQLVFLLWLSPLPKLEE